MLSRDKIKGMLVGGAIGDAWGMPVESWSKEKIRKVHPNGLNHFVSAIDHKWFNAEKHPPGTITDDTQLTIATMRGLIDGKQEADKTGSFDSYMDSIAKAHTEAMKETDQGWGNTTREAIRRITNGVSWKISGRTNDPKRGTGNGVPMKISPLSAYRASVIGSNFSDSGISFNQRIVEYSSMTHYTQMSAYASVIHFHAIYLCLWSSPQSFDKNHFIELVSEIIWERNRMKDYDVLHLNETNDSLYEQFKNLNNDMNDDLIHELFGPGSCYVYESLPFSYAWFLKNYNTMHVIQEVVEAGGDTDTNAKIVGEMLGALHGLSIFELPQNKWAIESLGKTSDMLLDLGNEFCDTFEIY